MVVKNDYEVCEINKLKIPYSAKARVEDWWIEVTDNFGETYCHKSCMHTDRLYTYICFFF